ncbi:MAG: DNA polymerase IV [Acidimicrobiales bacterium]|nr:DNA polymerase IV [Acidimicrobiales bacterium]
MTDRPVLGADGGRVILHVDMDAFYVSVELRRRPELRGRPVVVGGTGRRGVVAAASYEARRYGVFSAMPSSTALRRCPDAVFLPGDHDLYASVSRQVHDIFHSVTPLVEPLALDEAFLDVGGALRLLGPSPDPARTIADHLRARIAGELDLVCSVGGATSKFLAKLASKRAKPRVTDRGVVAGPGVVLVSPGAELDFVQPLPVEALWGVGPATLERLRRLAIRTVGDLARTDVDALVAAVGQAHGRHLHDLAWARDDRPVEPEREAKSIGHEETYAHDLHSSDDVWREAVRLADAVASRVRASDQVARTVTLKLRFADFVTVSRSHTATSPVTTAAAILDAVAPMLERIELDRGVRLIGISVSGLGERAEQAEQLSFDDLAGEPLGVGDETDGGRGARRPSSHDWETASETIDAIRGRFGSASIGPASSLAADGLRLVRPGAQQWGPDRPVPDRQD